MPHTSQTPMTLAITKPITDRKCKPEDLRPVVREDAEERRADQAAGDDIATTSRLKMWSSRAKSSSSPSWRNPTSTWPSRTCSSVSWIWYGSSSSHQRVVRPLLARAQRQPARREPLEHELARVRLRDLEHVEVRVDLEADGGERRDRAVEEHEARRQLELQAEDQAEDLADDLDRVDLVQARAVVAVVDVAQLGDELLLLLLGEADAERGEVAREPVDVLVDDVDEEPRRLRHVVVGQLPGHAEVDDPDPVGRSRTRTFDGCGSPWKNPWRKIIAIHASAIVVARRAALLDRVRVEVDVLQLLAVEAARA